MCRDVLKSSLCGREHYDGTASTGVGNLLVKPSDESPGNRRASGTDAFRADDCQSTIAGTTKSSVRLITVGEPRVTRAGARPTRVVRRCRRSDPPDRREVPRRTNRAAENVPSRAERPHGACR